MGNRERKSNEFNQSNIEKFERENKQFLDNSIIKNFLEIESNKQIYLQAISNPTPENRQKLDNQFKHFYFNIRFLSHISSTLKFNSINYDKRFRLHQSRFSTTLDAPLNLTEGEETFIEVLANDENNAVVIDELLSSQDIREHINCPLLYEALNTLTDSQIKIIHLFYVEELNDTEIASLMGKTQQAISKNHKTALRKIKDFINSRKDDEVK